MVTYYITTSILLSSVTTVVCCMSLKICLSIWFNCFVLVFCVLHCPWPSFAYLLINSCKLSVLIRSTWGYTGGGSVDSLPHLVCLAGGQLACVFANRCFCVSLACMEREWRLPSLPTTGPGLHLLLWEEDSVGGAGEGLHVLQACKETKEGAPSSWESVFLFTHCINHSSVTSACCVWVYDNPDTFCSFWYGQNISNSAQNSDILMFPCLSANNTKHEKDTEHDSRPFITS